MHNDKLLLLTGKDIDELLVNRELEIIEQIKQSYLLHYFDDTVLPHSQFLKFKNNNDNRIISLAAFVGGEFQTAGVKWIASFPNNIHKNKSRATAVLILNSITDGFPFAILEGSVISAKRTAASAVLALNMLVDRGHSFPIGLVGCGKINFEVFKFINQTRGGLQKVLIHDSERNRAENFAVAIKKLNKSISVKIYDRLDALIPNAELLSFATTTSSPIVSNISLFKKDAIVLNISLRDLSPEVILESINIVDDVDHVLRANTSVHLTYLQTGNIDFITCTIGEIIAKKNKVENRSKPIIFSPFGLGILDIALGHYVYKLSKEVKCGSVIDSFFPH